MKQLVKDSHWNIIEKVIKNKTLGKKINCIFDDE